MRNRIIVGLVAVAAMLGLVVGQPGPASQPFGSNIKSISQIAPGIEKVVLVHPAAATVSCTSGYICGFPCVSSGSCGSYYRVSQTTGLNVYQDLYLNAGDYIYSVHNNTGKQWRVYHYDLAHGGCGSNSSLIYANTRGNMNEEWKNQQCIKRVS